MLDLRTAPPALSLPFVIRALRVALGAWTARGFLAVTLALLVHRRLGEICQRFERLAQRFAAGLALRRLRVARSRGGDAADAATAEAARAGAGRVYGLGRFAGWCGRRGGRRRGLPGRFG
jgi:transposase